MRTRSMLVSIGAITAIAASCQAPPPTSAALTDQDTQALRAMFDSTVSRVKAKNWAAWAGEYASDGVLHPPNAPRVTGRAALQAWGEAFPPVEDLVFTDIMVSGEGNLGYGSSTYVLTIPGQPADTGKQLVVFRRAAGGPWEVVAASFNSDRPMPVPAPGK